MTHQDFNLHEACANQSNEPLSLPFFHSCSGHELRDIFRSKEITPSLCKKFNENLLYMFYGLPAYDPNKEEYASAYYGVFPVIFIIKNNAVQNPKRLFPFDSGAFKDGLFSEILRNDISQYQIGNAVSDIAKYIKLFFGDERRYINGEIKVNQSEFSAFYFEVKCLCEMISTKLHMRKSDIRYRVVEAQLENSIKFSGEQIKAIIVPSMYLSENILVEYLFENDVDIIDYDILEYPPSHMIPHLIKESLEYIESECFCE